MDKALVTLILLVILLWGLAIWEVITGAKITINPNPKQPTQSQRCHEHIAPQPATSAKVYADLNRSELKLIAKTF